MIKKGSFNKLTFTIENNYKNMYGHYIINSTYKGKKISVVTTDSSLFDNIDNDEDVKKQREARKSIYIKIKRNIN